MTRVKICGITTKKDLTAAVAAGADAVGFTVDVPVDTPREITADRATELRQSTPPFVTTVLVTMPDRSDETVALIREVGVDTVQVHGDVGVSDLTALAEGAPAGTRIVRAVEATDREAARRYEAVADALLVDTPGEKGRGGTGRTSDWEAARSLRDAVETPIILAGGLTPANVAEAVDSVKPFAVDVASGVERAGGRKDHDAIEAFVANATDAREVVSR